MSRRIVHAHHRRPPSFANPDQPADQRRQVHLRGQHYARGGDRRGAGRGAFLGGRHRTGHSARQAGSGFQPLREARRQQEEGHGAGPCHLPPDRHDRRGPHLGRFRLHGRRAFRLRASHRYRPRWREPRGGGDFYPLNSVSPSL